MRCSADGARLRFFTQEERREGVLERGWDGKGGLSCLVLSGRCGDLRQDVGQNGCVRCQLLLLLLLDATYPRLLLLARLLRLS